MADPKKIFRKASLDRLSSPEQLDELIRITNPKGWIALTTVGALLILAILWGIFGTISTKLQGESLLISGGGIAVIPAPITGRITDISVRAGEHVSRGQVVARIYQGDILSDLYLLRKKYRNLQFSTRQQLTTWAQEKETLRKRINVLKKQAQDQEYLFKKGLIVKSKYLQTKHELDIAKDKLDQYKVEEAKINHALDELKRKMSTVSNKHEDFTRVISRYSGRIVEVNTNHEAIINAGDPVVKIERSGPHLKDLEALVFVSPLQGKQIQPGMQALISPGYIKREEYGSIIGRITSVSKFPASLKQLQTLLKNESEAQKLIQQDRNFIARADLEVSSTSPSGYQWTSAEGPPIKLRSGTKGSAEVTVRKQRPISLLIPLVKDYLGF